MSRKAQYKPGDLTRMEDMERRMATLEDRLRRAQSRQVQGPATATTSVVSQTTHGLAVGNVIRHNGTIWTKSQADTAANAVIGGIVIAVLSPDVFVMATGGYVSGLSGLTAGAVHYLDAATAGALTTTAPTIQVPIIHADTTTSGAMLSLTYSAMSVPDYFPVMMNVDTSTSNKALTNFSLPINSTFWVDILFDLPDSSSTLSLACVTHLDIRIWCKITSATQWAYSSVMSSLWVGQATGGTWPISGRTDDTENGSTTSALSLTVNGIATNGTAAPAAANGTITLSPVFASGAAITHLTLYQSGDLFTFTGKTPRARIKRIT